MPDQISSQRGAVDWLRAVEAMQGSGSWTWESANAKLTWSAGLYELIGVTPTSVMPSLSFFESLVHPRDRLPLDDPESIATDKRHRNRKFRIIRPDGQLRWLQSQMQATYDRNGVIQHVVTAISDVTDAEDVKARLSNREALLDVIAHLLEARLWTADSEGRLVDIIDHESSSEAAGEYQAYDSWRDALHPDDRDRILTAWRDNALRKTRYSISPRIQLANGEYRTVYVAGLPFDPELSPEPLWGGISSDNPRALGAANASVIREAHQLTPAQVRACRALLGWSAEALASRAGLSVSTIRRIEGGAAGRVQDDSLRLIVAALQNGGVTITRGDDGRYAFSAPD